MSLDKEIFNLKEVEFSLLVGRKIQAARYEQGYSQEALAKELKCTDGAIGLYENAVRNVSLFILVKISIILNLPLSYFLENLEIEKYYEERDNAEDPIIDIPNYNLEDNIEFSLEMSIRSYLLSIGTKKENLNKMVNKVFSAINKTISSIDKKQN